MTKYKDIKLEEATPNPEYLIKSIAEQGYSLESSIADLIDNSLVADADKVEILVNTEHEPFILYLVDNGNGMDEDTLRNNMQFPSASPETKRGNEDLGRFGLGMKTASFSQTRRFTVISREKGTQQYSARTWDVGVLAKNNWKLVVNSDEEIDQIVSEYKSLSNRFLNRFEEFSPNTIVVWSGLYKYEDYLENKNRKIALKKEITETTTEHLSLVFHRFMEKKVGPLQIRINNQHLEPFNPFPTKERGFRPIEEKQRNFGNGSIKIEGFVLPSRSIDETKHGLSCWTTRNRSLMDMEGIYIYRLDRIIIFGGWNGLIKKMPRLQLARLRVEIGNSADHLLHLNVAKSQVIIPYDLRDAFEEYIDLLKLEAEREFYNRGMHKFTGDRKSSESKLFERVSSNRGTLLEINPDFPLLQTLKQELSRSQITRLNLIIRIINTTINKVRQSHEDMSFLGVEEKDGISIDDLVACVQELKASGLSTDVIKRNILPDLGYRVDTLPEKVASLLRES